MALFFLMVFGLVWLGQAPFIFAILTPPSSIGHAYPFLDLSSPPWMVIPTFLGAFIFSGLAEEFGWRGYFLVFASMRPLAQ